MYFFLGASIKLAFLLFANLFAAVVATLVWRLISHRLQTLSPHTRAQLIFALRVGPVLAAFVFVFGFVVPAYILHEPDPAESGEVVTLKLAVIAGLSCIALLITCIRVVRTWLITRRLQSSWSATASEIEVEGASVPVLQMEHPLPVIAVVGIFRPRIFVARQALDSLTTAELKAAIAHEEGHIHFNDNLKRSVLRIARDTLLLPIGLEMDKAWAKNIEAAADEYATGRERSTAVELASAIVKLARITPASTASSVALHFLGEEGSEVDDRVRRLLMLADGTIPVDPKRFRLAAPGWVWPAAILALCFLHVANPSILLTTHNAIERFVSVTQ